MIITIKGATYTYNIGALDSWFISRSIGSGATYDGVTSVKKGESFSATVTIKEGYEIGSAGITVTMGGEDITDRAVLTSDEVIVISIAPVEGNVVISVPTKNIATGEEEEPDTPTNYTFTINPDPTSATVTLSATGYSTVSGTGSQSITVANGTTVNWSVSASGYTTRTGDWTISGGNKTENITLSATGGGGGTSSDSVDLTALSNVKTSDVTYTGNTGTFTSTSTSGITGTAGKLGTGLTFIVQEPLTAGMEVEVAITDTGKKNMVLGLNNNNTMESLAETATYSGKIMATPVNLYLDPGSSNTIMSFKSSEANLVKPKCTGDGATIVQSAEEVTYTITFKRAADGVITAWQDGKQIIPPIDSSDNNAGLTTQWNSLNSVDNVYLCGHGVSKFVSCKINYFGKLR
jgi:hypothetical protein